MRRQKPDVLVTHCTLCIETVEHLRETAYTNGVETMSGRLATEFVDLDVAKETAAMSLRWL
jgi:hypothetical protein